MATKTQQQVPAPETPASSSCYFKKPVTSTFFENCKLRFDEFVHAPMDDHKACFKNTIQKVKPGNIKLRFHEFVHAPDHKACLKNTIQKVSEMPKAIKEKISLLKEDGSASSSKDNQ